LINETKNENANAEYGIDPEIAHGSLLTIT
jgi:hypothetical protein